ncbi:E3 ubiquitin-protein ligase PUB23-like [Neltuma alba]|uniref:E3 ubiquitin-protein ligase PUB23-like n=1 Tax=Neltuma alba TaxID=207710 RepID=UPI0010A2C9BE|nr:E3 ubiquitin-protein ligase PUB23-like [Prosopis alba]
MDHEIDVPPFFICPVSLEIMKDPVTVSTGITYDRESIEKWLFSGKSMTCPVTKQPLSDDTDLTPNHTLRRLIQAWCTMNASHGIERIPTPKPPVTKTQISKLIRDASRSPHSLTRCLRELKSIASDSETNRRCMEASGAVEFLASIISTASPQVEPNQDEALSILHSLHVSEASLKSLITFRNGGLIDSLTTVMQKGVYESRAYAVLLLNSMFQVADSSRLFNIRYELFVELVQILKDQISQQATYATLQTLIQLCPWGRNRHRAVKVGCVWELIELLLDCEERKVCEMMLVLLDMLCSCAEGRAELLRHGAGLAVVSKKILRVSTMANERAVRILLSVSKSSATASVVQEMIQVGAMGKLCLVMQMESGSKTKEKAREILKLHALACKNSACMPSSLGSYLA